VCRRVLIGTRRRKQNLEQPARLTGGVKSQLLSGIRIRFIHHLYPPSKFFRRRICSHVVRPLAPFARHRVELLAAGCSAIIEAQTISGWWIPPSAGFCTPRNQAGQNYQQRGGVNSEFMCDINGQTVAILYYSHKRRTDSEIDNEQLRQACMVRIHDRLVPEIRKAFQFNATPMERTIVACYSSDTADHLRPHCDNTSCGTAHRRFAVSLVLNAESFEGGFLRFPEFGRNCMHLAHEEPSSSHVHCCTKPHLSLVERDLSFFHSFTMMPPLPSDSRTYSILQPQTSIPMTQRTAGHEAELWKV
jgi:hypothetical protein